MKIIYTTDVHGSFFPYDYVNQEPASGSLARVKNAVDSIRKENENVVLLDNGDILQGQPIVYYYNYIATDRSHILPRLYDFLGYDAATVGNHDIETGHPVYDRVYAECRIPIIVANIIDKKSKKPYFKPYVLLEKGGIRIAVLGMITPAIPGWLPEVLWEDMEFEDIENSASKWVSVIQSIEKPDVIIGLFHSGRDASKKTGNYIENASMEVAKNVPGFDAIFMGHDHQRFISEITNKDGQPVWVLNPANNANSIGVLDITLSRDSCKTKRLSASIVDVRAMAPSAEFLDEFKDDADAVSKFVEREIGVATGAFYSKDAFFGPSAFMTLLHRLQLKISGAEVSFAAPLSFSSKINAGKLTVSDMFKLYKYENMLYTMDLTGLEIKNYLEKSYDLWTKQITADQPHLINFESDSPNHSNNRLKNPSYNFDSAAGIIYTVDVTKPFGERINILSMSDGTPFDYDRHYTVAVNSYRGNGGGNLLTEGSGIPAGKLSERVIRSTDKDLRYYLLKEIELIGTINADVDNNWRFVPEDVASKAIVMDEDLLFSDKASKEQK